MAMNASARPGSMSGAEMDWDVLGTCEGLRLLVNDSRIKVSRVKNTWEGECVSPPTLQRTQGDRQGTVHQAKGEVFGMGIKSGCTHYWRKTRKGGYTVQKKTSSKKIRKGLKAMHQWCKENRHKELSWQHEKIKANFRAIMCITGCQEIINHYVIFDIIR